MYVSVQKMPDRTGTKNRAPGREPGGRNIRVTPSLGWFATALRKILTDKKTGEWLGKLAGDSMTRDRILWYLHRSGRYTELLAKFGWDPDIDGHGKKRRKYSAKKDALRIGDAERLLRGMEEELGRVMPPWYHLVDTNFHHQAYQLVDQLVARDISIMRRHLDAIASDLRTLGPLEDEKSFASVRTKLQSGIHGPKNGDDDDGGDG